MDGVHVIIVLALLLFVIIFAGVVYWLIKAERWDFAPYIQPDPTSTDAWFRIHGSVTEKPIVGTPCSQESDCTSGIALTCSTSVGTCLSIKGGSCVLTDDCIDPNTCVSNICT